MNGEGICDHIERARGAQQAHDTRPGLQLDLNYMARHSEFCAWRFGMNADCDCGLANSDPGDENDHVPPIVDAD